MSSDTSNNDTFAAVRPEDHTVLVALTEGYDDVRQLNRETSLSRRQINYSLTEKLEPLGLITVDRPPDGTYREETIDGTPHRYPAPKEASLTLLGQRYLDSTDRPLSLDGHRNLDRTELVQKVHDLEERQNRVEERIEAMKQALGRFKTQVKAELSDDR